ncbi:type III secretion protein [Pseudomonas sp. MIACH]|jgi:hypothetical protein|uniref:type III secretion protein n=1 Tax=Pseudomonas sp. MIACH TaxID=1078355 RepID=UPI00069ED652|nr:type III secretion protein [Pseudomonas sp. MIACH]
MRIIENQFSDEFDVIAAARTTPEQSGQSMDVNFFTSLLESSHPTNNTSVRPGDSVLLTEASKHLSESRNGFAKILRSTKTEIDVEAIANFPRELYNAQLTSQLMVKCLAKTTQGIDKICNMQS